MKANEFSHRMKALNFMSREQRNTLRQQRHELKPAVVHELISG